MCISFFAFFLMINHTTFNFVSHLEIDEVSHSEKQKPQVSEEAHMPRRAPKLTRNAGTDTVSVRL